MKDTVQRLFRELNIEYFALSDYSVAREINRSVVDRSGITPRSVIIYLLPYYTGEGENLSSYAVGVDYHLVLKRINSALIDALSEKYPENSFLGFGDHSPIDERSLALITGLGAVGKNGLLINEKYGSYVFIGEIISDREISGDEASPFTEVHRCLGCGACLSACPTGILSGDGRDCLSAITQKKGELSQDEQALMIKQNTVWGCDVCQKVCPHNKDAKRTPVADFYEDRITYLTRERLDAMDKPAFSRRAYAWRGRKTIERNLDLYENAKKGLQKQQK